MNFFDRNKDILLLVAHPDDETIFCGGTMLLYPNCQWTIACLTEGDGNASREEFEEALDKFKNFGVNIKNLYWLGQKKLKKIKKELSKPEKVTMELENKTLQSAWKAKIEQCNFSQDIVLTHNERGEYGHPDHKGLNLITKNLFSDVWEFFLPKHNDGKITYKKRIAIELNDTILQKKRDIVNDIYKSQAENLAGLSDLCEYELRKGPEIFISS